MNTRRIAINDAPAITHADESILVIAIGVEIAVSTECQGRDILYKRGAVELTGIDHKGFRVGHFESVCL